MLAIQMSIVQTRSSLYGPLQCFAHCVFQWPPSLARDEGVGSARPSLQTVQTVLHAEHDILRSGLPSSTDIRLRSTWPRSRNSQQVTTVAAQDVGTPPVPNKNLRKFPPPPRARSGVPGEWDTADIHVVHEGNAMPSMRARLTVSAR
jgi:hypothetical protein